MSQNTENNNSENTQNTEQQKTAKKTVAKKKPNKRAKIINYLVLILVLVGLFWVVKAYFNIGNDRYTNASQVESFINPINTRVSAYIKEIRFIEHQYVKKGDTLMILDDREIQTQLGQAEAAYMSALASKNAVSNSVKTATNNVNTATSNAQSAKANIEATKARLWNAEQNYKRYENLLKDEAVTRQQFDQIKSDYEAQKAQLEAQILQYRSSKRQNHKRTFGKRSTIEIRNERCRNKTNRKRFGNGKTQLVIHCNYRTTRWYYGKKNGKHRAIIKSKPTGSYHCGH